MVWSLRYGAWSSNGVDQNCANLTFSHFNWIEMFSSIKHNVADIQIGLFNQSMRCRINTRTIDRYQFEISRYKSKQIDEKPFIESAKFRIGRSMRYPETASKMIEWIERMDGSLNITLTKWPIVEHFMTSRASITYLVNPDPEYLKLALECTI